MSTIMRGLIYKLSHNSHMMSRAHYPLTGAVKVGRWSPRSPLRGLRLLRLLGLKCRYLLFRILVLILTPHILLL